MPWSGEPANATQPRRLPMNDQMPDFEPPAPMFEDPKPKQGRKKPAKRRKAVKKAVVTIPAPKRRKGKKHRRLAPTDKRLKANRRPVEAGQQTVPDAVYGVLAALIAMEKSDRDLVAAYMGKLFK